MADIEKTPVIQFRTDDSGLMKGVTSIKELKTAIAQLRDEEVKLRQAGQDTTKVTNDLQAAQRELNTVMGLTKKGVDGVEGSYDSLVAKLREAKTEWRALPKFINGELNPAWEKARQQVEQYTNELKNMDASVGNYQRNVGNYKSALEGFSGTMGQAAQIGGDFKNGIAAMSNIMLMAGVNTEGMSDAMRGLSIVVGVLQGAKGFSGLIGKISSYIKESVKAVSATKADTTAKNANTTATETMATAETAAAGATTLLGTALKAIGIGLIVAAVALLVDHIQDIANWLGKVGEKLGIVKKQSKEWEGANERLTNRFEEQNRELQLQQKVLAAQGKTKKELLEQQKAQIQLQINETKATIANIEARVKQMQADSGWVRFWKGENKKIKEAQEEVKALSESLKGLYQNMQEVNVDIRVEEINGDKTARDAAAKARAEAEKKAAEALKKAQDIVNKGTQEATKAIDEQKTAIEKLEAEYKKNEKTITDAIDKLKTISGVTGDIKDLESGLSAIRTNYYTKRYELQAAEDVAKIMSAKDREYETTEELERVYDKILGINNQIYATNLNVSAAERKRYDTLREQQKYYRKQIELTDSILNSLKGVDYDDIVKEFGEPIATAIKLYFDKSKELKDAGYSIFEGIFSNFEQRYREQLESGRFDTAERFAENFVQQMEGEFEKLGLSKEFSNYLTIVKEAIYNEVVRASEEPLMLNIKDNTIQYLEQRKQELEEAVQHYAGVIFEHDKEFKNTPLEQLREEWWDEHDELMRLYYDAQLQIYAIDEEMTEKRKQVYADFYSQLGKYINTYGVSTGKVLGSVADFWEAELQAKVKNGKKTEEEAKRSFKAVKALQISTAVINTAAAVVQALADTTVPSYYVKAANAIAAGIAGAAEVVKIASTDFSSSGSYSASNSAPTLTQTPQMVNTYGINPVDYAEANAANPVRVYVLEQDITEAQNAARTRVAESTF